jgi:hypothetical protein
MLIISEKNQPYYSKLKVFADRAVTIHAALSETASARECKYSCDDALFADYAKHAYTVSVRVMHGFA